MDGVSAADSPRPPAERARVTEPSPLLALPGAVAAAPDGPDRGLAWHYGDPMGEQRAAEIGAVLLDGWTDEYLAVTGADRLTWLHTLTTQHLTDLADGTATQALWLSPNGHLEHEADLVELDGTVTLRTDGGSAAALQQFLESMVFWSKVEVVDRTATQARLTLAGPQSARLVRTVLGRELPSAGRAIALGPIQLSLSDDPGSPETDSSGVETGSATTAYARANPSSVDLVVNRRDIAWLARRLVREGAVPAGSWAAAALRVPARQPRFGVDVDERTIPNELPWLESAVHLDKGCYRGQETVARVSNLGLPPRRLVMLHLDGTADTLPSPGDPVLTAQGRPVGRVGTVAQHWEDGPIALALVKRSIQPGTPLLAGGVDAAIDPADAVDEAVRPPSVDRSALPDLRRR
jgi:folate-binding protein YgfZ